MPTRQEIAQKANEASVRAATRRRFHRYAMEMAQAPIPDEVLDILAEEFRSAGWTVTPPAEPAF